MYRILVIEDNPAISQAICDHLTMWGYEAKAVNDFSRVMDDFDQFSPHLTLLDIGLPGRNGYHYIGEIRKRSKAPVLFISSAADNLNIVTAIELGGDDFIPKPFDLTVLTAKIQAQLRRAYSLRGSVDNMEHGSAILDLNAENLCGPCGKADLTKNEFRILRVLMENSGHVVSRSDLMTLLWESESFIDDNTLTVNISRLRKKLESVGLSGMLTTKKGQGYILK